MMSFNLEEFLHVNVLVVCHCLSGLHPACRMKAKKEEPRSSAVNLKHLCEKEMFFDY